MTSMIVAAAFMLVGLTTLAAAQSASRRTIDLDAPGALAALQQINPAHYAKVRTILSERRLSFALDDTRYVAVITLTNVDGTVVPLK
jgi:hypothetical protein